MKGARSVVGVVDGIASHVACVHVPSDVEVDRIPGQKKIGILLDFAILHLPTLKACPTLVSSV